MSIKNLEKLIIVALLMVLGIASVLSVDVAIDNIDCRTLVSDLGSITEFLDESSHYSEQGRYEVALIFSYCAIQLAPDSAEIYVNHAGVLNSMRLYEEAFSTMEIAADLDPENTDILVEIASMHSELEQFEQALDIYNTIIALDPDTPSHYVERGLVYEDLRQYEQAIADYDYAIQLDDQYLDAYLNRGFVYGLFQYYEQAFADLEYGIELAPQSPAPYLARSLVYHYQRDFEKEAADLLQALELDPDNINILEYISNTYMLSGDPALAEYQERLRQLSIDDPGESQQWLENLENAVEEMTRIITLNPQSEYAYQTRGDLYMKFETIAALDDYLKAVELNPDNAENYLRLWKFYTRIRDPQNAISSIEKAIELEPDNPEYYWSIGDTYQNAMQDTATAIGYFDMYLELAGDAVDLERRDQIYLIKVRSGLGSD